MSASLLQPLKDLLAPSDEHLMWRVQMQDDPQAFAELVGRWQPAIQRLCTRMVGDPHRAEDLTQEVFSRLFAHRKAYRPDARFSAYVRRIALNQCYNELRRVGTRREVAFEPVIPEGDRGDADTVPGDQPHPDEQTARIETADAVRRALARLSDNHRAVLVLRHYENLKFREIADLLDLPEGTVKTRMTEALSEMARLLRRTLDLRCQTPPGRRAKPRETISL